MTQQATTKSRGNDAELAVANYLQTQGFTISARNFTCRGGEIDIIATKGDLVVFVEVKMRATFFTHSHEIISSSKQRKCAHAAQQYIAQHRITDKICRFDVAFVSPEHHTPLTYIPNAFQHPLDNHTW